MPNLGVELEAAKADLNQRIWNKPARQKFAHDSYKAFAKNDNWQADLADFMGESGSNRGYLLVVVDVFTRYLCRVMPHKSFQFMDAAFDSIFEEADAVPRFIHANQELAITKSEFLKSKHVHVYHTPNSPWVRGLPNPTPRQQWALEEPRTQGGPGNPDHAQKDLPRDPNEGTDTDRKQISDLISGQNSIDLNTCKSTTQRSRGSRLKVGDKVLLQRERGRLEKATSVQNWDRTPYEIVEVLDREPVRYKVKSLLEGHRITGTGVASAGVEGIDLVPADLLVDQFADGVDRR
jgi:hypothetical protein